MNEFIDLPALSIRQPWAWMILHAGKDIENRCRPTRFRGRVLIHAAKGCTRNEYEDALWFAGDFEARTVAATHLPSSPAIRVPELKDLPRGGIIGEAELVDCVRESESPWFVGEYGFVLRNVKPLPFTPCVGALRLLSHPECEGDSMNPRHLRILQHALGADKYGRGTFYRNRYVVGPDCDGFDDCRALVAAGFMIDSGPVEWMGCQHSFRVTEAGITAMREASPEPPKLTRSERRYREFLNADSGYTFEEWLKVKRV